MENYTIKKFAKSKEILNGSDDKLMRFLNDKTEIVADIFIVFERLLNLGIKELFFPNRDAFKSRDQRMLTKRKQDLFSWNFDILAYDPDADVSK